MPEVVITEFMDGAAAARIAAAHETLFDPDLADAPARLAALVPAARALIVRNRTRVEGALLDAASRLECVGRLGVGLDNIDVAACAARGIDVYPATGANDDGVAEWVVTAVAMLLRGAYLSSARVRAGAWPRQALIGREAGGRTLGLVGYGGVARRTAARARAFGMRVLACDPFVEDFAGAERATLAGMLPAVDALSLHVPLTEATRNLIDADALAAMRPDAVVVNAARGGVLDEAALADALRGGRLAGAALDVFASEPLGADNPFGGLDNLILTPHIAGVTEDSNVRVSALIADRVLARLG